MTLPASAISLPFLLALFSAIGSFFVPRNKWSIRPCLLLHLGSCLLLTGWVHQQGPVAFSSGGWSAPYGIVLILDELSSLILTASSFVFLCCVWGDEENPSPFYWPLLFLLQGGVCLSLLTGDLFNLFVAFELLLISSYALLVTQGNPHHLNNSYSYLITNFTASSIYLVSISFFYGYTGELNFASLSQVLEVTDTPLKWIPMASLLIVVAIKGGLFPFYFWLPDAYPILPPRLAALFSGILSKVGIYVLFRLFLTVFPTSPFLNDTLSVFACLTMFLGVMGAVSRSSIPGILSYHTLSQVGYIVLALSLRSPLALTAGIFFLLHNMVVKSSLFLIGGIASDFCGSSKLKNMGGLWVAAPFVSLLFLLQAFSLAALPPLSGFWGKYLLFFDGLTSGAYGAIFIALTTSFFTLYSMIKIWNQTFIGEAPPSLFLHKKVSYTGPILLTLTALIMGCAPHLTYSMSEQAAQQLLHREAYTQTSLQAGHKG